MKNLMLIVNSALGAVVLTLMTAASAVIYLMFTTRDDEAYREALFGGVYFSSHVNPDNSLSVGLGVGEWLPLALITVAFFAFLVLFGLVFRALARRQTALRSAIISESAGDRLIRS